MFILELSSEPHLVCGLLYGALESLFTLLFHYVTFSLPELPQMYKMSLVLIQLRSVKWVFLLRNNSKYLHDLDIYLRDYFRRVKTLTYRKNSKYWDTQTSYRSCP